MSETQRIHPQPMLPLQKTNPTPYYNSQPHSCTCCRIISYTLSILFTLLFIIGILALVFYLVYHPKAPKFSIDNLRITDLRLNLDLTLYAKFNVKITAQNPNEKIGIYYEKGGKTSVWYTNTELCRGSLPAFYQGPVNKTKIEVSLVGQSQYGNTLMSALQQQQQTGNVPLDLKVDQPVAIRVAGIKFGKVRCVARCKLTVDSLSSSNLISIKTSSCSIKVKL